MLVRFVYDISSFYDIYFLLNDSYVCNTHTHKSKCNVPQVRTIQEVVQVEDTERPLTK